MEAVRLADVARKWRVPEFVGLGLLITVVALIEASVPEYEQFIPSVSFNLLVVVQGRLQAV